MEKERNEVLEEAAILCDEEVKRLYDERIGIPSSGEDTVALGRMAEKIRTLKKKIKTDFFNFAGDENNDAEIRAELEKAGIKAIKLPEMARKNGEVKTVIFGEIQGWGFERAWRYWVAKGPGIPPEIATKLHEEFGNEVRVSGHCSCPSPLEWLDGFAVGMYHVDTAEGLKALADVIKGIYKENEK